MKPLTHRPKYILKISSTCRNMHNVNKDVAYIVYQVLWLAYLHTMNLNLLFRLLHEQEADIITLLEIEFSSYISRTIYKYTMGVIASLWRRSNKPARPASFDERPSEKSPNRAPPEITCLDWCNRTMWRPSPATHCHNDWLWSLCGEKLLWWLTAVL